jgi:hypothetical protein
MTKQMRNGPSDPHLDGLIDRFLDGDLIGADREALEQLLLASPQARSRFWSLAGTHAALGRWGREHWGRLAAAAEPASPSQIRRLRWPALAAAVIVPVCLALLTWSGWPLPNQRVGQPPRSEPFIQTKTMPISESDAIATIAAAVETVWADPTVELMLQRGSLPLGPIHLHAGRVELLFRSGGTAVIEGPAIFEPISGDTLRMQLGSVRCRCPELGSELRVETPRGTVTDLGTEFVAAVAADEVLRVGVIEGQVRLDLAGATRVIAAGEALSVNQKGQAVADVGFFEHYATRAVLTPFDEDAFRSGDNLLEDPSFETPPDADAARRGIAAPPSPRKPLQLGPWSATPGHVEGVSAPIASGQKAVRVSAKGSPFWPLLVQRVSTGDISGRIVMASVKATQPSDDPLSGAQRPIVKIAFVDALGREFASAGRHFMKVSGPDDQFAEGRIAAIAPEGTCGVNYTILLNACGQPTGSVVMDDARLVIPGLTH